MDDHSIVWALVFVAYFLPAIIAEIRRKANKASVFVVNLFFGWTVVGWVGCLAWALLMDPPRQKA